MAVRMTTRIGRRPNNTPAYGLAVGSTSIAVQAYYRMDDRTVWGTSGIFDSSGLSHPGNGVGTAYTNYQPGLLARSTNEGLKVPNQAAGGSIRIPQATWMESVAVSWAMCLQIPTAPPSDFCAPVTRRGSFTATPVPYAFYIASAANALATPSGAVGACNALISDSAGVYHWAAGTGVSICDGKRHHVVFTTEIAMVNFTRVKCYLDGVLTGTADIAGPMPTGTAGSPSVAGSDITLGSEWSGSAYVRGLTGFMDEVAFWTGTLTQTDVTNLYNAFAL